MTQDNHQIPLEDRAFLIGSEVNKNGDKTYTRRKSSIGVGSVWLEVTSCLFGLISIAAIVATLYPHQNKPIPQWPFQISINTLLSIYGFVLKLVIPVVVASCLGQLQWTWFVRERPLLDLVRYESAANGGLLGSVQWLWFNHIREPLTAFGVIITLISIIIDPFIQQLVQYEDCSTVIDATASIPRTNYFESIGVHMGAFEETIDPGIQNAISAGLFGSAETISAECLTGNCTFPQQYASLGFCSGCQDISDQIHVTVTGFNNISDQNDLNTTLPSGLSTAWEGEQFGADGSIANNNALFAGAISDANGTMEFLRGATWFSKHGLDPTTNTTIDGCDSSQKNQTSWRCSVANAVSCSFKPCVRVYNASVTEGQLLETMVSSSSLSQTWGQDGAYISSVVDTQCTSSQQNASLAKLGYKLTSRWLAYNSTFPSSDELDAATAKNDTDAPFPTSLFTRQCVYTISPMLVNSLWEEYLSGFFTGNLTTALTESNTIGDLTGPQALQTLYNNSYTDFQFIESAIQKMSESITNYMRRNGQVSQSVPATGYVLHSATCLHVSWPWITLPLSIAIATCVLFVLTIIKVNNSHTPKWKTSLLPTLFNGPALSPEKTLRTEKEMETEAAKTVIVLDGDSHNGFQLVETSRRE